MKLKDILSGHNYNVKVVGEHTIEVALAFNLLVEIEYNEGNLKSLRPILKGFNFLSGFMNMELFKTFKINTILLLIIAAYALFESLLPFQLPILFTICLLAIWGFWSIYYLVSFYDFKRHLQQIILQEQSNR